MLSILYSVLHSYDKLYLPCPPSGKLPKFARMDNAFHHAVMFKNLNDRDLELTGILPEKSC